MTTAERGIPVSQAAERLGISVAAARKRVRRGSLRAYKVDGQWFVLLPMSTEAAQDAGGTNGVGHGPGHGYDARDALIEQLRAENARLWDLVARLAGERVPELPAPETVNNPGTIVSAELPQQPASAPKRRGWLSRLLGRVSG